MRQSRTKNTIRNTYIGLSCQVFVAVCAFISRTFFIKLMGVSYLGINGLYSNILTMLALSDLGIYTVMVYSLYKPLAQNDKKAIIGLVRYYQWLYRVIAVIVLGLGLLFIPLLPLVVKKIDIENSKLVLYYVLYLLNSVSSYIAISKVTLLKADQKNYIIQLSSSTTTVLKDIVQIIVLYLFRNYTFYLIVQILFVLSNNLFLSYIADIKYPYLRSHRVFAVPLNIKQSVLKNTKATFLYKIGNVIMNSSDNILISVIAGTILVGFYSNYMTVISTVDKVVMILINAVLASIGNFIATKDNSERFGLFKLLLLCFYGLSTFCCMCYICGMDDFITIWIGKEYVVSNFIFPLSFYRFVRCSIHPLWMIRESSGMFISTRYLMLCTALSNIILSVVFGKIWGLPGIITATGVSYLITQFWYEPIILCKYVFKNNVSYYWAHIIRLFLTAVPCFMFAMLLREWSSSSFLLLLIKFLACFCFASIIYYIMFRNSQEGRYLLSLIKKTATKISNRLHFSSGLFFYMQ